MKTQQTIKRKATTNRQFTNPAAHKADATKGLGPAVKKANAEARRHHEAGMLKSPIGGKPGQ